VSEICKVQNEFSIKKKQLTEFATQMVEGPPKKFTFPKKVLEKRVYENDFLVLTLYVEFYIVELYELIVHIIRPRH